MKKKLNEKTVINELKGSSLYFQKKPMIKGIKKTVGVISRSVKESTIQSTGRPTGQSTRQPTDVSVIKIDGSPILGRPKAFYITEKQVF